MKRFLILSIVLSLISVTLADVREHTHISSLMRERNQERRYQVILPPGYNQTDPKLYPVVIFLHGTELNEKDYPEVNTLSYYLTELGQIQPMIVVKPDGNFEAPGGVVWDCPVMPSWWVNSTASGDFETYIVDELPQLVANEYKADLSKLFLMGHSSGGFGALYLGFKHPEKFMGIVSLSGLPRPIGVTVFFPFYVDEVVASGAPGNSSQGPNYGLMSDLMVKVAFVWSPVESYDWSTYTSASSSYIYDVDSIHHIGRGNPVVNSINNMTLNEDTRDLWARFDVLSLAQQNAARIKEHIKLILLDVGINDDFGLVPENDLFHEGLKNLAIPHEYTIFDVGAGCCPVGTTCGSNHDVCGAHFADKDGMRHGAAPAIHSNGQLPYTGGVGSRFTKGMMAISELLYPTPTPENQPDCVSGTPGSSFKITSMIGILAILLVSSI